MNVGQALQLALALIAALQHGLLNGALLPDDPVELSALGAEHQAALDAIKDELRA